MSVMLWTSVASYPRSASQRRSHMPMMNGRAFPICARAYTVGPQKYIRIGPGASGRSCFPRVYVSYSRIEPPQRLVPVECCYDRGELRTAVAPRERDSQRVRVSANRLQLAHERLRRLVAQAAVRTLAQLSKPR